MIKNKEESVQEKMSSPVVNNRQNPLLIQQSNATLQSIQFERKETTEKKPQSLAPLNQKQKGEQNSNLIYFIYIIINEIIIYYEIIIIIMN